MSKIVIIGGGLAGLAAAYKLADKYDIEIIEKDSDIGGMAASYKINNYYIEKYYHHFFETDSELISLIYELGLKDKLKWLKGSTGYYIDGKIYPMTTPFEILRALPISDVIKLTWLVFKAKNIKELKKYDDITAKEWIIQTSGNSVYKNFFEPLLQSKFGENKDKVSAAWLLGRVKIRSNRSSKGEKLGYIIGGFQIFIDEMIKAIKNKGVVIRNGNVFKIEIKDNEIKGLIVDSEYIECDKIISTISPNSLKNIIDTDIGIDLNIKYQGTVCALFGLKQEIMKDIYWLNIKGNLPFGAVIEHTNFMPISNYGENLMYVTSYFQNPENILWKKEENEVINIYITGLEKIFPNFRKMVKWWKLQRDKETAPVYEVGYSKKVIPYKTNIKGLYLAGMFSESNYPERSMNGSILAGFRCADHIF